MATSFTVNLTGDQENPPTPSTASGTGTITWDPATNTATYSITVTGLDFGGPAAGFDPQTADTADDVTNAHFHTAPRGTNGPVVFGQIGPAQDPDLDIALEPADVTQNTDESWTLSGDWTPSDPANQPITTFAAALTAAAEGEDVPLYFNVHTGPFPSGEIRGQLVAANSETGEAPPTEEPPTEEPPTEEPPTEEPPTEEPEQPGAGGGGGVDWDAVAAVVQANFAATGKWFPGVALPPAPVDWDAVAAEVTANFESTGQWYL